MLYSINISSHSSNYYSLPNNSETKEFIGAENAAAFGCEISHKMVSIWALHGLCQSRNDIVLVIQSKVAGIFLIRETPRPPGYLSPTYRDRITVVNFSENNFNVWYNQTGAWTLPSQGVW